MCLNLINFVCCDFWIFLVLWNVLRGVFVHFYVIVIQVNGRTNAFTKSFLHFIPTILVSTFEFGQRFLTDALLNERCDPKINQDVLVESRTEHDVCWFDVAVDDVQHVHLQKTRLDVFLQGFSLDGFALFHYELDAVLEQDEVERVVLDDFGSDLQGWHQIANEEFPEMVFETWQIVLLVFETLDDDRFCIGNLLNLIQALTIVHTAERAESDKSVLMTMTFFELVEDSVLFGVRAVLEENLHDVMMFGLGVNFGFELNFTRGIS